MKGLQLAEANLQTQRERLEKGLAPVSYAKVFEAHNAHVCIGGEPRPVTLFHMTLQRSAGEICI